MAANTVTTFTENFSTMTFAEGLAFIERTRRQLARFDALPGADAMPFDAGERVEIERLCDELEADMRGSLGTD